MKIQKIITDKHLVNKNATSEMLLTKMQMS